MIIQRIIGAISHGIDGQDLYLRLEEDEGCITKSASQKFFEDNYYTVTNAEAGGFFCHSYDWLPIDTGLGCGVLIVYQRYDV